jgi:hypothetical protein
MAKKQQVSEAIQNKFNKPQFKPGDAVHFLWLGQKLYGYVTKTKQTSWGIQYMVETYQKRSYPCGIEIQGVKTAYSVGCIFFEETRAIGNAECAKRITAPTTFNGVYEKPRSTDIKSEHDTAGRRRNANKDSGASKPVGKERSSKSNANDVGSAGSNRDNTTKRKNSKNPELDTAIEKQRNFLNGFIKPD